MIDILQDMALITFDISLASIKQSTYQHHQVFIYAFSPQANTLIPSRQSTIQTTNIGSRNGVTRNGKHIKVLPDLPIFINGKNLSID